VTLLVLAAALLAAAAPPAEETPAPPVAPKQPYTRTLHGETFVDEYFWIRNKGTPEVEAYLRGEREYALAFMKPTEALQQKLYDEMLSRIQQTDLTVPYRDRGFFYYSRTQEGRQYPIHCRRKGSLDAAEQVLLDVNQLAFGKAFVSVGAQAISPDGTQLAFTVDETGFRQYTLHVKDLGTGALGPEAIPRVTSVAWAEDGRTLFYAVEHPQTKRSHQVYRHTRGQTEDELIYDEKDERFAVWVAKSRDREYLFVGADSHTASEVRFVAARTPAAPLRLIAAREPEHEYDVEHRNGTFWIRTNDKGRNFRLVTVSAENPDRAGWKEVIAHRDDVMLSGHDLFKDFHVLIEREGGLPHLRVTDLRSGASHRIEFPEPAYQAGPGNNREFDATTYRLTYQSPVTSSSIYDYDPFTRQRALLKQVAVLGGYDPARYKVEWTRATAADGTAIPIWLLSRKEVARDGTAPALLYGYGSYGASMSAGFNSNLFSLVDRGVVYALAYVRGGGELGKKWHDDGRMMKKKNTFTDFIAAAEFLVKEKYAAADRLAIQGGSAGGLLVGAVVNLCPELFRAATLQVPFVDVINSMYDETLPLTVGEFEEWGNPKVPDQYRYMLSYSPYENIGARAYPTMLVKSSYNDSQVMYWEPAKYVARLRALKTDRNPLLFHINMDPAGHGGKSGRYDRLRETAFDYAFVLTQLGAEKGPSDARPKGPPPSP
jgi:oligopeptidase B